MSDKSEACVVSQLTAVTLEFSSFSYTLKKERLSKVNNLFYESALLTVKLLKNYVSKGFDSAHSLEVHSSYQVASSGV